MSSSRARCARRFFPLALMALISLALAPLAGHAQDWPNKAVNRPDRSAPEIRTTPIPPRPGAVAIAAIGALSGSFIAAL